MYDLMFLNRKLEDRFRQKVARSRNEMGGFLFYSYWREHYGSDFYRAVGNSWVLLITHWLIMPNIADNPATSWATWDMQRAWKIAQANDGQLGQRPIHFHTHPNGSLLPSPNDYQFWAMACQEHPGQSQGVIVAPYPLRAVPFQLKIKSQKSHIPVIEQVTHGHFFTWREARFRGIHPK